MSETTGSEMVGIEKLTSQDRVNIANLRKNFLDTIRKRKLIGEMQIVGGVLTKPLPRKDIDVLVYLTHGNRLPRRTNYKNELEFALDDFEVFRSIVEETARKAGFGVGEEIVPFSDQSFDNPNILAHDGSIKLTPKTGTEIEMIRYSRRE